MPETTAAFVRSKFSELLAAIGDGTLEEELSTLVIDLSTRLKQMGESGGKPKGSISLRIDMKYDRGVFEVDSNVSKKEPQAMRPRTLMYPARDGGLSRNNQHQIEAFSDKGPRDTRPARSLSIAQGDPS